MAKGRGCAEDTFEALHGRVFQNTRHLVWAIRIEHCDFFGYWADCASYYESLIALARRQRWVRKRWFWGKSLKVVCPP